MADVTYTPKDPKAAGYKPTFGVKVGPPPTPQAKPESKPEPKPIGNAEEESE